MSGNFTILSCKSLDVWSWCTFLLNSCNFRLQIRYHQGNFNLRRKSQGNVREFCSVQSVWTLVWVCTVCSDLIVGILWIITANEPRLDKTNKMAVRPAKTQISLGICPVRSESSLSAWRNLGSLATHWAHSEDSDQTGRMPRLIWVFAERTLILLVLSCRGSNVLLVGILSESVLAGQAVPRS